MPSKENGRRVGARNREEKLGFERLEMFLVKCTALKEVRAVMWVGFWAAYLGNEKTIETMLASMRGHVTVVENELERWKSKVDGSYQVPRLFVATPAT